MKKICYITNYAAHYHLRKWKLLEECYQVDFVFSVEERKANEIKMLDLQGLVSRKIYVKNFYFHNHMIWQSGVLKLAFKKEYNVYLVTEEVTCLSIWLMSLCIKAFRRSAKLYRGDGHGWYGRENILKRILKKIAFKLSDGEFVYGGFAKNVMIRNGLDANKIWVVHNSLNHAEQLMYRGNITSIFLDHFGNSSPVILFIGRLTREKKLTMILHSLVEIHKAGAEANCVFIGKGEMQVELSMLADSLGLNDKVWFYGDSYSESEISELITNAHVCVSPGFVGLTAIHSMVYGTPVITHNDFPKQMPEFEAIKPGLTGDFFKADDTSDLTNKILKWVNGDIDRNRVRMACYNEIDNYWTPEFKINTFKAVFN